MPRTTPARLTHAAWYLVLPLVWALADTVTCARDRARRLAVDDRGSETVEKAVITALVLGLALGLAGVITAVVHKYQGQIH
ncbi:hypothetical protein [Saccharopolyspora sp. SCSIO 74807]|uniref:hypothetical protein n=1 Tax=Saccharopolyspora sp. SCSIO 74807 TaxID=3118084 RepID=UPI0030D42634